MVLVEAMWHLTIAMLRPAWEWNHNAVSMISFILQNIARVGLLPIAVRILCLLRCCRGGGQAAYSNSLDTQGKHRLSLWLGRLFRGLVCLSLLESLELIVLATEVKSVCDAPEVRQAHLRQHPNATALELLASEQRCELIADVYDYLLQLVTMGTLGYFVWITHSFMRRASETQVPISDADDRYGEMEITDVGVMGGGPGPFTAASDEEEQTEQEDKEEQEVPAGSDGGSEGGL